MLFKSARGVAASVAAVFAAELLVFVAVAARFGVLGASLISLLLSIFGMRYLVRSAPGAVARSMQDIADVAVGRPSPGPATDQAVADRALLIVGALLLAFPGLVTGAFGAVLFVGPVRRLLAPSLGSRLSSLLPAGALDGRSFQRRRDVVDATATVKDPARPPASSADRAQAQPHVHELP